jgi:subtilisin family serine protease
MQAAFVCYMRPLARSAACALWSNSICGSPLTAVATRLLHCSAGLDAGHPDLRGDAVDGCKFEDSFAPAGCPFNWQQDLVGHGTHVAGACVDNMLLCGCACAATAAAAGPGGARHTCGRCVCRQHAVVCLCVCSDSSSSSSRTWWATAHMWQVRVWITCCCVVVRVQRQQQQQQQDLVGHGTYVAGA